MKKNLSNHSLSENFILNNYLKKLNLNKKGTFNFENDASYLKVSKNNKLVITSDSISEGVDFFKNDPPESIAKKIITINLSDLSAMGASPLSYSLNIFLPSYTKHEWLHKFSLELLKLQKKYMFYLIGGDLSKSNKLQISSTFFGLPKNKVVSQNKLMPGYDIFITGNLGDSFIGLQILKKKIFIKNTKIKKYFIKKYYFPKPCMLGPKISKYVVSMKDISDGFVGDLKKMLNLNYGAKLYLDNLPLSVNMKKLLSLKLIKKKQFLNSGDDYELIITSPKKNRNKIINFAKKNKTKITLIGRVLNKTEIIDDSNYPLIIPKEYDHFC